MFCSIAPPRLNFARPQKGRALFNAAGSIRVSGPGFASELNVFQRTLGTRLSILPEPARWSGLTPMAQDVVGTAQIGPADDVLQTQS